MDKIILTVLGNLDPAPLVPVFGPLQTTEVIVTDERTGHIREQHPEDYLLFEQYAGELVSSPDILLKDRKNAGTIFAVKNFRIRI